MNEQIILSIHRGILSRNQTTYGEFIVLLAIGQSYSATTRNQIAKDVSKSFASVQSTLDRLRKKGLAFIVTKQGNQVLYTLTTDGRIYLNRSMKHITNLLRHDLANSSKPLGLDTRASKQSAEEDA